MPYFFVFMPHFVVWILWPELQIYSQGVWFFIEFKNITIKFPTNKLLLRVKAP